MLTAAIILAAALGASATLITHDGKIARAAFAEQLEAILRALPDGSSASDVDANSAAQLWALIEAQLQDFNARVSMQLTIQHWSCIGAAAVGMFWLLYFGSTADPGSPIQLMAVLPGVGIELVALIFLWQTSEMRSQMWAMHERRLAIRRLDGAVRLARIIDDQAIRDATLSRLAILLADLASADSNAVSPAEARAAENVIVSATAPIGKGPEV